MGQLKKMLDEPDPRAPSRGDDGQWKVRELVRVNHLRNCLLCHAPSVDSGDYLRGRVPEPDKPIPVEYYHSPNGTYVRADVTYLRQDFSVSHPVPGSGLGRMCSDSTTCCERGR